MTHETVSTGKIAIVGILFNAETTGFTLTNHTVDTTRPRNRQRPHTTQTITLNLQVDWEN